MPRYFFDIKNGENIRDFQGSIHENLAAARLESLRYSSALLTEHPDKFWNGEEWTMFVSDHNRVSLFTLKFQTGDASANT
jgi:hypothetical protein